MSEKLGFIGVGNLGGALVEALLKAGRDVAIFDTDAEAMAALKIKGAQPLASARAVGDEAAIVFACLPTPEVCEQVALAEDGVAAGKAIEIYVETSTLGLAAIDAIAAGLTARDIQFLDNPIVGGGGGAGVANGKAATITAGPRSAFARVEPILKSLARKVFYAGEKPGLAQVCKCVNAALAITGLTIACEAMVMGVKAGVDPKLLLDIVNAGSGRNVTTEERFARTVLTREFGGNAMRIMSKDMKLYAETAHALGLPSFVGSNIAEIWNAASAQDVRHLVQFFESFADVEVKG
ncbi:MAG TPA: NAD(P)-dependent oxidoreductase [Stellaceae bacterium]|jgi:2-hydroxy-3-oxopropionate reductase|nr:NAD(P)-dependent oxidoreductase [Stellaceae bacterium]